MILKYHSISPKIYIVKHRGKIVPPRILVYQILNIFGINVSFKYIFKSLLIIFFLFDYF